FGEETVAVGLSPPHGGHRRRQRSGLSYPIGAERMGACPARCRSLIAPIEAVVEIACRGQFTDQPRCFQRIVTGGGDVPQAELVGLGLLAARIAENIGLRRLTRELAGEI